MDVFTEAQYYKMGQCCGCLYLLTVHRGTDMQYSMDEYLKTVEKQHPLKVFLVLSLMAYSEKKPVKLNQAIKEFVNTLNEEMCYQILSAPCPGRMTAAFKKGIMQYAAILKESPIRLARKRLGLKQTELAQLVGVEQKSISQWESGHVKPSSVNLIALSQALHCSIEDLLE